MRILYLSQYFPPEIGATQTRAYEMARHLVRLGHQVTMIAEIPNHPSGVTPVEYRGKLLERSTLDGIDVMRVWVKASPVKTRSSRLAFYLSYMVDAFLAGVILARGRYILVYASSPPLFVACAGWGISRIKRIPFVMEVRDLWPAVAVSLGEISSPRTIRLAERLEKFLYRHSAGVVAVTRGFCKYIQALGVDSQKITWIPNGTDPELFNPVHGDRDLRKDLELEGRLVILYAGLLGIAQGLESVLETARLTLGQPDIMYIFIGEGPNKVKLTERKKRENLDNVIFLPEVPREDIISYLNMADILLVPLKNDPIFEAFVPSKLYDFMACGKPVLLSVPGEAREILEEAEGGLYVPPENPEALKEAILKLYKDPDLRLRYGANGRRYMLSHYSRSEQALQLEEFLRSLTR